MTKLDKQTKLQTKTQIQTPLYTALLFIAVTTILYYGRGLLIPVAYGAMFAFLVNPLHGKLVNLKLNRYLSAMLCTALILLFVLTLLSVLGWQIQSLTDQSDQIKQQLVEVQHKGQDYIKEFFGITISTQKEYAENAINNLEKNIGKFVGGTAGILANFLLSLIYSILLLAEKKRIRTFFICLFDEDNNAEKTIEQTSKVAQSYLVGQLSIIAILATIYSVGFSIVGIKYAILLGVLAAFLAFIPYAGNLIGGGLAAIVTIATGGALTDVFIILGIIMAAQLIESYILQPMIVGSSVNLNPLFSILGVIGLGSLWGAAGAVIALPMIGMLKVLFDHIATYQPIGYLMSDNDEKSEDEQEKEENTAEENEES